MTPVKRARATARPPPCHHGESHQAMTADTPTRSDRQDSTARTDLDAEAIDLAEIGPEEIEEFYIIVRSLKEAHEQTATRYGQMLMLLRSLE